MGSSNWECACACVAGSQPTSEKFSSKKFLYVFCVCKYFYNELKANYGIYEKNLTSIVPVLVN